MEEQNADFSEEQVAADVVAAQAELGSITDF
jgi:hypothetical protein